MKISEEQLHEQICIYIASQYPNVIFNTDLSGIKLSDGQKSKIKPLRSGRGFPDIMILETALYGSGELETTDKQKHRVNVFHFCGLYLEVKRETPYKKDNTLKKQKTYIYKKIRGRKIKIGEYDHLQEQNEIHKRLRKRGYMALFVWDFEQAKRVIDDYLK